MLPPTLPSHLAAPVTVEGRVVAKVMVDLTVYLAGPSEEELEFLLDLYERICPAERLTSYKIAEVLHWVPLSRPILTESGRNASSAGEKRPHFEPVRNRIREGRALEVQLWDGRSIEDPAGSWSLNLRRIFLRSSGLHAFVRILVPLNVDLDVITNTASEIAENVEFYSGHGGFTFVYDPWQKGRAFDEIYARSRRYWGVDVEDLNASLQLMREAIKSVNWITLLGKALLGEDLDERLSALGSEPDLVVKRSEQGAVIIAGPQPVVGDQHRPDNSLEPYQRLAALLSGLHLTEHDDFAGIRFMEAGNTVGWLRRFIEPDGWR